nr:hypothetical protein [Tanacetum cinerariifolium]
MPHTVKNPKSATLDNLTEKANRGDISEEANGNGFHAITERRQLTSVSTALLLAAGIVIFEGLALYFVLGVFLNLICISSLHLDGTHKNTDLITHHLVLTYDIADSNREPTHVRREEYVRKEKVPQDLGKPASDAALREYYDGNYHQLLPIITEKVHQKKVQQEKLKAVKARLNFEEASQHSERGHSESPRKRDPERKTVFKRLKKGVFHKLGDKGKKKCIKDPVKIHNIKQRDGEFTEEFVRRYKLECRDVKGAPECMKISGFMHGITNLKLIKHLHDKTPKSVDEMMWVTTTFLRCEVAASSRERKKSFLSWKLQEAGQKQNFNKGSFQNQQRSKRKQDKFTILTKTPKKIALDKENFKPPPPMTTPVKQRQQKKGSLRKGQPAGNTDAEEDGMEGLMIIKAEMRGHCVHRMYVDGGSSSEILYEHCFNKFRPEFRNQMVPLTTPLVGFSGEIIWPLGQISVLVKIGDEEHSTSTWMNFMVVRSPSPYNGIIGRPGVRRTRAVPSITHRMLKIPMIGGTVTLRSIRIIPLECTMVSGLGVSQPVINQVTKEKIQIAIHPEYPEQTIAIGSTLAEYGRKELCGLLRHNLDIFSWKPADMTGFPRHIAEHKLNIREGCLPVRQKKKGQAPERNKAIYEEVEKLVDAGIMKEVHYHNAYKGYHQIKMAKEDEEKTTCITSQGIFCYFKMPFGLKNAGATYQRLVDKAFQKQIGQDLEVDVDDLVIKVRMEQEVEAVLILPSPKCLKDVQRLNGELASLNRFLSKSAEKSLSFFKTLKKYTKKSYFQWTMEAEMAFKQMKKLIAELPMLTVPKEKEELIIYLAAVKEAINVVLMTERDGKQIPIYFVSRAFQVMLSKMESTSFAHLSKQVLVEELKKKSIDEKEVLAVVEEKGRTWMTPIYEYLAKEILQEEKKKVRAIRRKAGRYAVTNGILYKRSFLEPLLRCVRPLQANYVLKEIHEGSCNMHEGPRSVVVKALRSGYYWPTMHVDARKLIRECNSCQIHRPPQANGLVEKANRSLGKGIKARNGETPFSLTYGTEVVILVETGMPNLRTAEVDMIKNNEALEINLDLLEEKIEQAAIQEAKSKAMMEKYYNARVRNTSFNKLIQQKLQNEYAQPFPAIAITFDLPTVELEDSLRMGDEHLDTILATESDELIKSSVENLVPSPSEFEELSDSECDVPSCDVFTTFSNLLFDVDDDFYSRDDESFFDEDILKKIYSNPLFDEEIISMKIDSHHFNAESDLIESLLNHDSSIISSSLKIDSLLDEFASELILLKSIPPGIDETDCDPEE